MSSNLKERIYQAQCLGNVEPIEHMVPYPNLRSLVDGQNVKYGKKMVYDDLGLTSDKIYRMAQQTANWLVSKGIRPQDRILMDQLPFPQNEVLSFGIWTLGASMILTGDGDLDGATIASSPSLTIALDTNYFEKIKSFSEYHDPTHKPLLADEAMVYWSDGKGIQFSHYNLLVNTNGVQHAIDLFENQTYHINIEPNSMPWVILQAMLPLYTGAPLTSNNPNMRLGVDEGDFRIQFQWDKLEETDPPSLFVCNENTAFIAMNKIPIHLTAMNHATHPTSITGHSVMMGYLENTLNEKMFKDGSLIIN